MAKKYKVKGSTRRKMLQVEMSKELRSRTKKTKPNRDISPEHQAYKQFDLEEE